MASNTARTIIMVHGFRGTHHGLALIADHLAPGFTAIVPDIPGFGEGEQLPSYNLEAYVTWLHRFIQEQQLSEPPVLLGHSFGSIIASAYAAKYSSTISHLILVNPIGAPALEGPRQILTKGAILYYWIGSKLPGRSARYWLSAKPMVFIMSTVMAKTSDKSLRQWIHQQHYTYFSRFHDARSVLHAFKTSVEHSVRDAAKHITAPTLLIAGDRDDITPLQKQRELHALFPQATLHVIPDVGHLTHYETPEDIAIATRRFVNGG